MSRLYVWANAAHAWVLILILLAAFAAQFLAGEPPCPLCVLQRIAIMQAALGPCYVLICASRGTLTARHVAIGASMIILASLLGAAVSIRQILLHILPGDQGFGAAIFGYHMYTWCALVFFCNILGAGLQLAGLPWFREEPHRAAALARATSIVLAVMLLANIASTAAEAGFAWELPADPKGYLLFQP
jgi:disulfide bond formation protein DsbB